MYNKIILAGNLTRDIEMRYTAGGAAIANTAIATSRKFKKADGSQGEEVLFIDLTFFGKLAEIANQYLKKGSKVLVDGRLKLDQWTAQDGQKRSKHGITVENMQMLGNKDDAQGGGNAPQAGGQPQATPEAQTTATPQPTAKAAPSHIPEIDINEDEIPF